MRELSDETIDVFVEFTARVVLPTCQRRDPFVGRGLGHEPVVADAVPSRGLPYQIIGLGVGGPDEVPALRTYLRTWIDALQSWVHERSVVNFPSPD